MIAVLALAAWSVAFIAPLILPAIWWRIGARLWHGFGHLLLVPLLLSFEWVALHLIFFTAGKAGESRLFVALLVPILALVGLSLAVYFGALAVRLTRHRFRRDG